MAQNAANSTVGRSVIAIAKSHGLRTVDLVRRTELVDELKAYGADVVVLDSENTPEAIQHATGSAAIKLALCGLGGSATARLGRLLAPKGKLVSYAIIMPERHDRRTNPAGSMTFVPLRITIKLLKY